MAEGKVKVTSKSLNVREGADKSFDTLGKLKKGDVVSYYSETNGWLNINYHNNSAYIMKEYTTDYNGESGGSTKSGSGADFDVNAAVAYNNNCGYTMEEWKKIQGVVGAKQDGKPGEKTAGSIAKYQKKNGLPVSGKCDEATLAKMNIQVSSMSSTSNSQNKPSSPESKAPSGKNSDVSNADPVVESKTETPVSASSSSNSEVIYDEGAAVAYNNSCGYTKDEWKKIQGLIGAKKDGDPGPKTARAIRDYQKNNGLPATGKCDAATLAKMNIQVSSVSSNQTSSPSNAPSIKANVQIDTEKAINANLAKSYTADLWRKIHATLGLPERDVPDLETANAVATYQQANKLTPVDGICGKMTLGKMGFQPQYVVLPHTRNYKQGEAPWGKMRYSNDPVNKKNYTYAGHGCGPTAAANVIHAKADSSVTPQTLGEWAMAHPQYMMDGSGTKCSFIPAICGIYGLTCEEKRPNNDNLNLLRRPTLAVANIDSRHFVTPYGVDGEHVYVDDPAHNAITKWTRKEFSKHAVRFWLIY